MLILVSYDISLRDPGGQKRLRRVAKACKDFGQRVQFSVFEIEVDPAQWVSLRSRLIQEIDATTDSLRFYFLGSEWQRKVEHIGAKAVQDLHAPLVI